MESFYISKRAKDGEYLEKKKEESGNITYIYSEKHVKERNKKKAKRLSRLSKSLKNMRAQVKKDITNEDDRTRLAALAVALIDETYERVGNRYSAADMKHYGVTTWLIKHVKFSGSTARIKYVGKSGVKQDKLVKTPKVVSALKKLCSGKKPSDLVFELDDFVLTDNNVNQYLRPFNITAKDIRGLHANVEVRKQLQKMKKGKDEKERKQNFKEAVEEAAKIVGHKASTLKNQYLIPGFEEKYVTKGEIIGPKTATRIPLIIKQAQHEGAMLAIMAPTSVKKELDISKECRPTFHLTLLYLGKAKDLSELELNAIQKAVKKVCERHAPIDMEITGAGVFNAGKDGTPAFVIPNGKGLSALQAELEEAVGNIIELPSEHGWVPHMTISYADDPELPEFSNLKWKADKVRFQVGDKKRSDIPIGKKSSESFNLSKRALTEQEYEEQLEKEYAEMERKEQERYDALTEEERKAEEEFWENYNKEFEAKELERQNRPKRRYSELTSDELEMLAEMHTDERQEWLNRNVEGKSNLFSILKSSSSNFTWTKPRFEDESSELSRVAVEEDLSYDSLKRSFKHGVMRPLDRKIWEHLDNTDSREVYSVEDAIALANNYGKNWEPIKEAFENHTSLPAPIVLELNNGIITLVGGNTRLAFARAYHVKPEVYWIKEIELFD